MESRLFDPRQRPDLFSYKSGSGSARTYLRRRFATPTVATGNAKLLATVRSRLFTVRTTKRMASKLHGMRSASGASRSRRRSRSRTRSSSSGSSCTRASSAWSMHGSTRCGMYLYSSPSSSRLDDPFLHQRRRSYADALGDLEVVPTGSRCAELHAIAQPGDMTCTR